MANIALFVIGGAAALHALGAFLSLFAANTIAHKVGAALESASNAVSGAAK